MKQWSIFKTVALCNLQTNACSVHQTDSTRQPLTSSSKICTHTMKQQSIITTASTLKPTNTCKRHQTDRRTQILIRSSNHCSHLTRQWSTFKTEVTVGPTNIRLQGASHKDSNGKLTDSSSSMTFHLLRCVNKQRTKEMFMKNILSNAQDVIMINEHMKGKK
jgi:hypothetical protein